MYCINCGVELADSETVCPLCGTRVFHPDMPRQQGEPPFPPDPMGHPEEVNRSGVLFILTVLALLPAVLHRGTMRCPDMEQLAAAMDRLYGAQISPTIRKRGETQCLGFVASFIDDRFVSRNEPLLEPAAELLRESGVRVYGESELARLTRDLQDLQHETEEN